MRVLKGFIDLEYKLPETSVEVFIESQVEHHELHDFFEKRKANTDFRYDLVHLVSAFVEFAKIKQISLRDIEQYFAKLSLIINLTEANSFLTPILTLYLLIIKETDAEAYQLYSSPESKIHILINKLNEFIPNSERTAKHIYSLLEAQIALSKEDTQTVTVREFFSQNNRLLRTDQTHTSKYKSADIINNYMLQHREQNKINLKTIISKIELLTQFNFDDSNQN